MHIDPQVPPVIQQDEKIPFHLRKGVNKQQQKLLEADIIKGADGPTLWLSKMIPVPKANTDEVRMCVDMKVTNNAIKEEKATDTHNR